MSLRLGGNILITERSCKRNYNLGPLLLVPLLLRDLEILPIVKCSRWIEGGLFRSPTLHDKPAVALAKEDGAARNQRFYPGISHILGVHFVQGRVVTPIVNGAHPLF